MRRVTILEKTGEDDDTRAFRTVFWYPIPAGREGFFAKPGYVSALPAQGPLAPSAAETTALRSGTVQEEVDNVPLDKKDAAGTAFTTNQFYAAAAQKMQSIYLARLAELEAYNPWILYGTNYTDEAGGWTLHTVADINTGSLTPGAPIPTTTTPPPTTTTPPPITTTTPGA